MTSLPNMSLSLPARGSVGSGEWGDTIDENYDLIDAHDHTTGKGPRVPTLGININADLPFSALYAPTQLHRVQFSSIAAAGLSSANNKSLFVSDGTSGLVSGELYWRNASGSNVQLTSGTTINASVIGGIGGDYTAVGAQVAYDDSGKRYTFKEGTADSFGWAKLAANDVRMFPSGTGTFYVGQAAPGGLAASYTATWPAALPGSTALVQVGSAGAITFGNTVASATTFSALITASAGMTCSANQSVAVSGTGTYKQSTKYISWSPSPGDCITSAGTIASPSGQPGIQVNASSTVFIPLPPLREYEQINTVELWFSDFVNQLNASSSLYGTTTAAAGTTTSTAFSSLSISLAQFTQATQTATGLTLSPTNSQNFWVKVDTVPSGGIARLVAMRMQVSVP